MNDKVKRYDCTNGGTQFCQGCYTMTETEHGDYVASEDYDALRTQVAELRAENERLRAGMKAEQGERQEAVAGQNSLCTGKVTGTTCISAIFPDGKIQRFVPEHSVKDVLGLVEALEKIADARETPTLGDPSVLRVIAFQALAAHRQAQRQA